MDALAFTQINRISQGDCDRIRKRPGRIRGAATVRELVSAGYVDPALLTQTEQICNQLQGTPYAVNDDFRAYPQEVFNFPSDTAFKQQLNIEFYAAKTDASWAGRIGIGFFGIGLRDKWGNRYQAWTDYEEYRRRILADPTGFLELFGQFNGFCYSEGLPTNIPLIDAIRNDTINDRRVPWRFFGRQVRFSDFRERQLLQVDRYIQEVLNTFDQIQNSSFRIRI